MFASEALPPHLKERYDQILGDFNQLHVDYEKFKTGPVPTFYAVWKYLEEMDAPMDYDEAQDLAERARSLSLRKLVPIKSKNTFAGVMYCYREDILDEAFEQMVLEGEE